MVHAINWRLERNTREKEKRFGQKRGALLTLGGARENPARPWVPGSGD